MEIDWEKLRQNVIENLRQTGFVIKENGTLSIPEVDKDSIRKLHKPAQQLEIAAQQKWIRQHLYKNMSFFANGNEITPNLIRPKLIEVTTTWQQNIFRLARLLWSIPYSKGYGRRLRFLIIDEANGKLIGILALQSPPLSFPARDRLFTYPSNSKIELVNQTMDIQTLGAVPPYDRLLGGKLIAMAAASNEVRQSYFRKYSGKITEIEKKVLPAHLVALTTTSAFGKSSIYNRLKYKNIIIGESLGYTEGYGSFHLMGLYSQFRELLENLGISTRGGFGNGPRRTWQTMVRALEQLGFSAKLLRHGVKREAFLFPLINNLKDYFEGRDPDPSYRELPFTHLADWWLDRWLIPRAERVDSWYEWKNDSIVQQLLISDKVGESTKDNR